MLPQQAERTSQGQLGGRSCVPRRMKSDPDAKQPDCFPFFAGVTLVNMVIWAVVGLGWRARSACEPPFSKINFIKHEKAFKAAHKLIADLLMRRLQWSAKLLPDPEECCKTCEWRRPSTLELISYYGNKMRPLNIDELFYFCQHDLTIGCLTGFIWPLFEHGEHYYFFAHLSLMEALRPVSWENWGRLGNSVG